MNDRVPPQNLDVEKAVLGAMLIGGPKAVDRARAILMPEAFYATAHRYIFKAICVLNDRGEPADLIIVTTELEREGWLDEAGGHVKVAELAGEMATAANIEYHASIVREAFTRRTLINQMDRLVERCYDPSEHTEDLLDATSALCPDVGTVRVEAWESASEAVSRSFDSVEEARKNPGVLGGVPTGLKDLDDMLNGLQSSDLILVAARPSIGKTALGVNIAWNASVKVPVGFVSVEMSNKALGDRFLSLVGRIDAQVMRRGRLTEKDYKCLQEAEKEIETRSIFLSEKLREPGQIGREARKLKRKNGIGLLIVDYLQLLDPPRSSRSDNREREVSEISRMMKAIAKDLDIPVVALSQLNRKAEDRADKRPQLSDLRDSGSLEQDSDVVILLHRPARYGLSKIRDKDVTHLAEAIVAKQRNGPVGTVKLYFDGAVGLFGNWRTVP